MNDSFLTQVNTVFNDLKGRFTPNKSLMMAIAVHMRESAKENIDSGGKGAAPSWPGSKMFPGKELLQSGKLLRSIQAGATDNSAWASTNRPGAALMHFGGEVKAKKILGSVKRKKDVWAMEQYFWRRWFESGKKQKFFMILALHMQKHNSINVPARPFMFLNEERGNAIINLIRSHIIS